MFGPVCFWIFSRFAIFNHFTTEPVRITVFLNDFLRAQLTVDLRYSLISRFNRSINIRNMLLEIFIIQQVIFGKIVEDGGDVLPEGVWDNSKATKYIKRVTSLANLEASNELFAHLVDEAHNLVDRAREMYSAVLKKEDFLAAKKLVKEMDKRLAGALDRCNKQLLEYKRQCDTFMVVSGLGTFPASLERVMGLMQKFMERHKGEPVTNELLEFFFSVRHFLNMYDCADEKYVYYNEHDNDGNFLVHLYCVDPSGNISERLSQGRSTVFFSATLLPVNYFKEMLSGDVSDRAVYAHSSFEPDNKRIVVATDVTSRYTRRNAREYAKVHDYIMHMISGRSGRYMVFFPSYSYMESVLECFRWENGVNVVECGGEDTFLPESCVNVLVQGRFMKEADKENFLSAFYEELPEGASLAGFCVLGGIFSEGIDLKDESLIGAVIVGTGIPMVCRERNILRDYFDEFGKNGYSYAYVIPGMNKVLQAAGRVIRTDTDKGVIALLDDRFMSGEYERMYPREWNRIFPVSLGNAYKCIKDFWTEQDI